MNSDVVVFPSLAVMVIAICMASVKGCQAVYNPESIRAETEQRIKIHQAFKVGPNGGLE